MNFVTKWIAAGEKHIDYGIAWKGALFLALVVFCINVSHGVLAALPAAFKQGVYTFFIAGFIVKLGEKLILNKQLGILRLPLATLIPACIAIGLTYFLHSLKGTPEPLHSTLPTIIMAPPSFLVLAWRHTKNRGGKL